MKNIYLIVNPFAGKMKSKTAAFDIIRAFCREGYNVTCKVIEEYGDAAVFAKEAIKKKQDLIVCCGGDGTLNGVISGMIEEDADIPIGYIPAGSTNDFANSFGLPLKIKDACKMIIAGEPRKIDVGDFDGSVFSYIASFGAFTSVSYNTPQQTKNYLGHFAYVLEGIKDLTKLTPYHLVWTADGKRFEGDYIFGGICNSTSIGGILKIDEEMVDLSDGEFEVIFTKFPKSAVELSNIVYGLNNSVYDSEVFDFVRASEITIESDGDFDWSLDGEKEEGRKKVVIKNLKKKISIIK
ncbi:MAG: diacylglycerol kinase family lipid kinase [Clostridia bacterium]|nr:diacylglycerol kinase family lipid kinase [Clostridia bacterium]